MADYTEAKAPAGLTAQTALAADDFFIFGDTSETKNSLRQTTLAIAGAFLAKYAATYIEGLELAYNSTTALNIEAGSIVIDGSLLTATATTVTSGSTMTDLDENAVTLGNNGLYLVYAHDNSGTLEFRVILYTGSGDGDDPVYDTARLYWKAPGTPVDAVEKYRCIGFFWTNTTGQISKFTCVSRGRYRKFEAEYEGTLRPVVSAAADPSGWTAASLAGILPGNTVAALFNFGKNPTSSGVVGIGLAAHSPDTAWSGGSFVLNMYMVTANNNYLGSFWFQLDPTSQAVYWEGNGVGSHYLLVMGGEVEA